MYLNAIEEKILSGEYGEVLRKAMEVVVKVGEVLGAERLIDITHAHISGVSYFNIGDDGLEFLKDLKQRGAKVRVYTTANPYSLAGLSLYKDENINKKQIEIIKTLIELGIDPGSFTCTPYEIRRPSIGEHLAWAESSAVIYANSLLGAFTNRESGITALMSALIGKTYDAGMHRVENRVATEEIHIQFDIDSILFASLLGLYIGRVTKGIPYIKARYRAENNAMLNLFLKNMLASIASTSNSSMAILDSITPPNTFKRDDHIEKISIDEKELKYDVACQSDTLLLGCPHLSYEEIMTLFRSKYMEIFKRYGINKIVVTAVSNIIRYDVEIKEVIRRIRAMYNIDIEVLPGACAVVSNLKMLKIESIYTPHGKALHYLYNLSGAMPCSINV
ncbi:aconitase X [Ignisphaera sp. 4213-co]|uniref:Phosphomevalonate dehydratase large subunit n=1 Tax=Ignisphaera cupida TaxID=3050454 RepID=A0ABD4Z794_9CREN|nr:aconitase X [Ignisphaera sp. 4213-co]MDK6029075.1 aconitase X [Ignisphaera sp. 4213-co]